MDWIWIAFGLLFGFGMCIGTTISVMAWLKVLFCRRAFRQAVHTSGVVEYKSERLAPDTSIASMNCGRAAIHGRNKGSVLCFRVFFVVHTPLGTRKARVYCDVPSDVFNRTPQGGVIPVAVVVLTWTFGVAVLERGRPVWSTMNSTELKRLLLLPFAIVIVTAFLFASNWAVVSSPDKSRDSLQGHGIGLSLQRAPSFAAACSLLMLSISFAIAYWTHRRKVARELASCFLSATVEELESFARATAAIEAERVDDSNPDERSQPMTHEKRSLLAPEPEPGVIMIAEETRSDVPTLGEEAGTEEQELAKPIMDSPALRHPHQRSPIDAVPSLKPEARVNQRRTEAQAEGLLPDHHKVQRKKLNSRKKVELDNHFEVDSGVTLSSDVATSAQEEKTVPKPRKPKSGRKRRQLSENAAASTRPENENDPAIDLGVESSETKSQKQDPKPLVGGTLKTMMVDLEVGEFAITGSSQGATKASDSETPSGGPAAKSGIVPNDPKLESTTDPHRDLEASHTAQSASLAENEAGGADDNAGRDSEDGVASLSRAESPSSAPPALHVPLPVMIHGDLAASEPHESENRTNGNSEPVSGLSTPLELHWQPTETTLPLRDSETDDGDLDSAPSHTATTSLREKVPQDLPPSSSRSLPVVRHGDVEASRAAAPTVTAFVVDNSHSPLPEPSPSPPSLAVHADLQATPNAPSTHSPLPEPSESSPRSHSLHGDLEASCTTPVTDFVANDVDIPEDTDQDPLPRPSSPTALRVSDLEASRTAPTAVTSFTAMDTSTSLPQTSLDFLLQEVDEITEDAIPDNSATAQSDLEVSTAAPLVHTAPSLLRQVSELLDEFGAPTAEHSQAQGKPGSSPPSLMFDGLESSSSAPASVIDTVSSTQQLRSEAWTKRQSRDTGPPDLVAEVNSLLDDNTETNQLTNISDEEDSTDCTAFVEVQEEVSRNVSGAPVPLQEESRDPATPLSGGVLRPRDLEVSGTPSLPRMFEQSHPVMPQHSVDFPEDEDPLPAVQASHPPGSASLPNLEQISGATDLFVNKMHGDLETSTLGARPRDLEVSGAPSLPRMFEQSSRFMPQDSELPEDEDALSGVQASHRPGSAMLPGLAQVSGATDLFVNEMHGSDDELAPSTLAKPTARNSTGDASRPLHNISDSSSSSSPLLSQKSDNVESSFAPERVLSLTDVQTPMPPRSYSITDSSDGDSSSGSVGERGDVSNVEGSNEPPMLTTTLSEPPFSPITALHSRHN